jgi:LDH2 family malate/lactate/ureidoglycolate dehydrogenase
MSPRFAPEALKTFVRDLFTRLHVPPDAARLMGDTLVAASLRGVDSHGMQLIPFYVAQIEEGRVDPQATGRVVSESGAILTYDGQNGLGQVVANLCARHAARLASRFGLGLAVARESNHFGAAAWWAQQIAQSGYIGLVLCNASPAVAPWQGRDPRWGTNPLAMALPGGRWLLDMATTTVAMGKIYKAHLAGQPEIPAGWAMDRSGAPTTSTAAALSGLLAPLGGYKGSGLAMMVEILCGALSGGAMSTELGGLRIPGRPFRVSQFFLAIDPERTIGRAEFERRIEWLTSYVKSSTPAAGYDEVLVAGEPEWRAEAERLRLGVPIEAGLWRSLEAIALRLQLAPPSPL